MDKFLERSKLSKLTQKRKKDILNSSVCIKEIALLVKNISIRRTPDSNGLSSKFK